MWTRVEVSPLWDGLAVRVREGTRGVWPSVPFSLYLAATFRFSLCHMRADPRGGWPGTCCRQMIEPHVLVKGFLPCWSSGYWLSIVEVSVWFFFFFFKLLSNIKRSKPYSDCTSSTQFRNGETPRLWLLVKLYFGPLCIWGMTFDLIPLSCNAMNG